MPDLPLLDASVLDGLVALSPDDNGAFVRELIDIFLQDAPPRLAEIDAALARGDGRTASRAAHAIKGSCGNFGAVRLHATSLAMERAAASGDLAAARALLPGLHADHEATQRELQDFRTRLK